MNKSKIIEFFIKPNYSYLDFIAAFLGGMGLVYSIRGDNNIFLFCFIMMILISILSTTLWNVYKLKTK